MAPGFCPVQSTPGTDLLVAALVNTLGNSPFPLLCSTSAHFFSPEELTYHSLLFVSMVCLSLRHPEVLRGDKSPSTD